MYLIFIVIGVTAAAISAECPTECYCAEDRDRAGDTTITTCIGDRRSTNLPTFTRTHLTSGGARGSAGDVINRLEIREYFLPNFQIENPTQLALIKELCLSNNGIEQFYIHPSAGLLGLRLLDLSFNNLTEFHSVKELGSLKILDLSHNQIERLSLEWFENLESLNLKSNAIEELSEHAFQILKSINYINLGSNRLITLNPNLFSNMLSLAHLILSSNPLNLKPEFLFNSRAQFIDMSNVGLDFVPPSLTRTVRDLHLNNNNLKNLTINDFESYPIVGLLVLNENQIENIEDDALGRLDFLASLWLNRNRLTLLPQSLPSSLSSLQVEDNRINSLNQTDFQRLKNLQIISLAGNHITSIEPGIFSSLVSLKTLNLRSNLIDSIFAISFANLTQLESLDLSQNPLKVIVSGAFEIFGHKLSSLYISQLTEPYISFDVTVFQPLSKLQTLNLKSSASLVQKLAKTGFGYFKSLVELNVENCELTDDYLPELCSSLSELDGSDSGIQVVLKAGGNAFNLATRTFLSPSSRNDDDSPSAVINFFPILCPSARSHSSQSGESVTLAITKVAEKVPFLALTTATTTLTPAQDSWSSQRVKTPPSHHYKESRPPSPPTPPTTGPTPTFTSSYFENTKKSLSSQTMTGHAGDRRRWTPRRDQNTIPTQVDGGGNEEELPDSRESIDGFPVELSGRGVQEQRDDDDDFTKMSFHQKLPPRMHLKSEQTESLSSGISNGGGGSGLILKTILISAGTCTLCVLILLCLGLTIFRLNGGRFVRRRTSGSGSGGQRTEVRNASKPYRRLEVGQQQESELGISNTSYFEDGQVYHIG